MASLYPGALDSFSTAHADGVSEVIHAVDVNNLADAVNKIEAELGINPSGAYADLLGRLADLVNRTIADAKGDLIVATAADTVARLAVGSNGQVLTADSAMASGVKWAAAAGGGGADGVEVLNVKRDYAAVGDGIVDDTTSIQNAVNAAAGLGKTVYIPAGTYKVTSISLPDTGNLRILGVGRKTVLAQTAAADRSIFWHDSVLGANSIDNVWIEGIYFLGAGQAVAGGGANQRGALQLELISNLVVRDCIATDCRDNGFNIFGKGNVRIEGNRLERCTGASAGNAINISTFAWATQTGEANYGDYWCVNNYVSDNPNGGIVISCSTAAPDYPSMEARVYCIGNTVKNCDWVGIAVEQRYSQEGIISLNQVYNCWVSFQIGTGGGTEFPNISRPSYFIVSENIVDMRGRNSGAVGTGGGILTTGSYLVIANNLIRHGGCAGILCNTVSSDAVDSIIVSGNVVQRCSSSLVDTSAQITLTNVRGSIVQGNQVLRLSTRVEGGGVVAAGGALSVKTVEGFAPTGTITVKGVQYVYTAITPAGAATNATITLTAGGTFTDDDEVLQGDSGYGIFASSCVDLVLRGNHIRNAGRAGIRTGAGTRVAVIDNTIINPWSQNVAGTKIGLYLSGSGTDTRVERNEVNNITGTATATIGVQIDAGEVRPVLLDNLVVGIATAYNSGVSVLLDRGNRKSGTHIPNGGIFSSTPGAVTTVNIPHGLIGTPTVFGAERGSVNSRGAPAYHVTADGTNIILTFASALTAATVYVWNWTAVI